ncbi:flavin-containing monooxygenase FMO GS-OX5 isoform X3 [Arachis hypogaea]|uniref:flavin-containing monooxygenase FMO GS-OX5 isoform X3 n=1 Tax=Arachis hypogaea TaxID=3818 RepID=UPI000DEDEC1C|nr:flavin-containing monooxygenase FMO GS-OX5 isoform X3 [Arachis hypogaea]
MHRSVKVAVIGAGVSGLVAARELLRERHDVVVYDQNDSVGGNWIYDPRTESDPLSLDPNRETVHSSLHVSLRTNLPRALMSFTDYPFVRTESDPRTFPRRDEVLRFLNRFADEFGVREVTRLKTRVSRVERVKDEWVVESMTRGSESVSREVFEAVVVCSGHNSVPRVAEIDGIENWRGYQMHSHNYRAPGRFQDQIKCVNKDGSISFQDGSSIFANTIIYCTGYKYHFPFLDINGIVTVEDKCVGPLYKHIFAPALAPSLSFIGIVTKEPIFLMAELQSKWMARVLSGKILLPTEDMMMKSIEDIYHEMEENGLPKTCSLSLRPLQAEYKHWLATQIGLPPLGEWREKLLSEIFKKLGELPLTYRDQWDDTYWDSIIQF